MASSKEMQQRAKERRKQERIQALIESRKMPNTTTWCDEDYAERLARNFKQEVIDDTLDPPDNIDGNRMSLCYIADEPTSFGSRMYMWDCSRNLLEENNWQRCMMIVDVCFNKRGMKILGSEVGGYLITLYVKDHAMIRLFERLRTNSRQDVLETCRALFNLPKPSQAGEERTVFVKGGRFHLVSRKASWVVKTFIREKL